jgi:nucleoside-diphosphate-sugar epimerase
MGKEITVVVGSRSNLSEKISRKLNFVDLLSSNELTQSLCQLDNYKNKKINVVFNNFQPSSKLNSFKDPSKYIDISIHLTIKVLMYLININAEIKKVIYTSSSSVYGINSTLKVNESIKPHATSIHGLLKNLNEKFLRQICNKNNINYTITRVFNMYGGNDNFSVVSKLCDCYNNNKVLTIFNKGESVRDFIHVDNVADIYVRLLSDNSINYPILNIGSGNGYSLSDLIQNLSKKGFFIKTKYNLSSEIKFSTANIDKLNCIINVAKFIDINDYLSDKFSKI